MLLKIEDLLMAGWVALASPILFRAGGDRGPFDPHQPLQGLLRIGAVICVVVCLAARRPAEPGATNQTSVVNWAAVGPFVGGLLLLTISGFVALDVPSQLVLPVLIAVAVLALVAHLAFPPLPLFARRALVTPFIVVAAGIYWNLIAQVTGGQGFRLNAPQAIADPHGVELALGFLVAFSAVYYAMLIYAPRQVAAREGGVFEWGIRYALFLASIVLGVGWLGALAS